MFNGACRSLALCVAVLMWPVQTASQSPSSARNPAAARVQPLARTSFIATMDGEYRKLDLNKDGSVSKAEVQTANQQMAQAAAAQRAKALFVSIDADRNGQVSADEFVRAQILSVKKENFMAMANRLDANRDQKITIVEYRTLTLATFDRLDADKDGVLSEAEQRAGGFTR